MVLEKGFTGLNFQPKIAYGVFEGTAEHIARAIKGKVKTLVDNEYPRNYYLASISKHWERDDICLLLNPYVNIAALAKPHDDGSYNFISERTITEAA